MRRLLLVWLTLVVGVLLVGGCARCGREHAIAKLEATQGDVRRSQAATSAIWTRTGVGALFLLGDGLRTAHQSQAVLGLDDGSKLRVRQDTTVRFSSERPTDRKQAFDVEAGQVLVEAGSSELALVTRLGVARVQPNSRVLIQHEGGSLRYDVTVGRALFESSEGQQQVDAGQSYFVSVGAAVVEADPVDAGRPSTSSLTLANAAPSEPADDDVPAQVTGSGVSQKLPQEHTFRAVPPGAVRLKQRATIRVQAGSSVELRQGGATLLLSGPSSYHLGSGSTPLQLQSGKLSVTGASRIVVPGGIIETADTSVASLEALGATRTRVQVAKGWATVSNEKGTAKVVAGEQATLSDGNATRLDGHGLEYSDFAAEAGESFVVHDPQPPTAIGLQFAGRCPGGGVIRAGARFASGETSASLPFGPGRHNYTLHCLGDNGPLEVAAAKGSITVLKDAGTRPVPTTPPATSITIDGRDYTVMYQNQLPRIAVTWPNAPPAPSYTLKVESRAGAKTFTTASPSYAFASGALQEGHHTLHFEGAGRVSRHTGLEITFDNAAPMASLATPVDPQVSAAGEVTVAGTAQPGWNVEIGGVKVEQDGKQRFNQSVAMPASQRAIAVKLMHPSRGTHVYLRRATRTP